MNKNELALYLAKRHNFSHKKGKKIVDDFINIIELGLQRGERIKLHGFGSFWVDYKKACLKSIPSSSQKIVISGHFLPKFRYSKSLKTTFLPTKR